MKQIRLISVLGLLLVMSATMNAQEENTVDYSKIWSPGKYTLLNYANQQTAISGEEVLKSSFSFAISKGAVYNFPKKPLWGCVKIGVDVRWIDFSFTKYKNPFKEYSDDWGTTGSEYEALNNLGIYTLQGSLFGVGPSIGVAPFSFSSNKRLQPLRLGVYFHYDPTIGAYMASNDGDTEVSWGYCNMLDFGVRITYRRFHLGLECRWGSGKFKPIDFDKFYEDDDDDFNPVEYSKSEKITRKFAATRFYIGFSF